MTKYLNLYYGKTAPLVCGARQFDTPEMAMEKASPENYYATIQFEAKRTVRPFSLPLGIGDKVQTVDGKPVNILTTSRVSAKGYNVVGMIMNANGRKEDIFTWTSEGKFQEGDTHMNDLVIV